MAEVSVSPRVTMNTSIRALGRHAAVSWAAIGTVLEWARSGARRRQATQSFGERAVKGCLWWVLFGWLFVLWRLLPYVLALYAAVFVATYAMLVSTVWLMALMGSGAIMLVRRRRGDSLSPSIPQGPRVSPLPAVTATQGDMQEGSTDRSPMSASEMGPVPVSAPIEMGQATADAVQVVPISGRSTAVPDGRDPLDSGPPGSQSHPSVADELSKLVALRDRGILTEEEFNSQKARLLG